MVHIFIFHPNDNVFGYNIVVICMDVGSLKTFSAVCWLFGKYLSSHVNYPIGLVESDWGGTPIEAWSSPEALHRCNSSQHHYNP